MLCLFQQCVDDVGVCSISLLRCWSLFQKHVDSVDCSGQQGADNVAVCSNSALTMLEFVPKSLLIVLVVVPTAC